MRSDSDATPLMVAASNGCADVVRVLISAGANVNARLADRIPITDGTTALMMATAHPEVVRLLLANGADVNAKTKTGDTALSEAAGDGQPETVRLLLAAGADVNARGATGTPLAEATQQGGAGVKAGTFGSPEARAEVANLLREHGGCSSFIYDSAQPKCAK